MLGREGKLALMTPNFVSTIELGFGPESVEPWSDGWMIMGVTVVLSWAWLQGKSRSSSIVRHGRDD